jgi:hypothetical protein
MLPRTQANGESEEWQQTQPNYISTERRQTVSRKGISIIAFFHRDCVIPIATSITSELFV